MGKTKIVAVAGIGEANFRKLHGEPNTESYKEETDRLESGVSNKFDEWGKQGYDYFIIVTGEEQKGDAIPEKVAKRKGLKYKVIREPSIADVGFGLDQGRFSLDDIPFIKTTRGFARKVTPDMQQNIDRIKASEWFSITTPENKEAIFNMEKDVKAGKKSIDPMNVSVGGDRQYRNNVVIMRAEAEAEKLGEPVDYLEIHSEPYNARDRRSGSNATRRKHEQHNKHNKNKTIINKVGFDDESKPPESKPPKKSLTEELQSNPSAGEGEKSLSAKEQFKKDLPKAKVDAEARVQQILGDKKKPDDIFLSQIDFAKLFPDQVKTQEEIESKEEKQKYTYTVDDKGQQIKKLRDDKEIVGIQTTLTSKKGQEILRDIKVEKKVSPKAVDRGDSVNVPDWQTLGFTGYKQGIVNLKGLKRKLGIAGSNRRWLSPTYESIYGKFVPPKLEMSSFDTIPIDTKKDVKFVNLPEGVTLGSNIDYKKWALREGEKFKFESEPRIINIHEGMVGMRPKWVEVASGATQIYSPEMRKWSQKQRMEVIDPRLGLDDEGMPISRQETTEEYMRRAQKNVITEEKAKEIAKDILQRRKESKKQGRKIFKDFRKDLKKREERLVYLRELPKVETEVEEARIAAEAAKKDLPDVDTISRSQAFLKKIQTKPTDTSLKIESPVTSETMGKELIEEGKKHGITIDPMSTFGLTHLYTPDGKKHKESVLLSDIYAPDAPDDYQPADRLELKEKEEQKQKERLEGFETVHYKRDQDERDVLILHPNKEEFNNKIEELKLKGMSKAKAKEEAINYVGRDYLRHGVHQPNGEINPLFTEYTNKLVQDDEKQDNKLRSKLEHETTEQKQARIQAKLNTRKEIEGQRQDYGLLAGKTNSEKLVDMYYQNKETELMKEKAAKYKEVYGDDYLEKLSDEELNNLKITDEERAKLTGVSGRAPQNIIHSVDEIITNPIFRDKDPHSLRIFTGKQIIDSATGGTINEHISLGEFWNRPYTELTDKAQHDALFLQVVNKFADDIELTDGNSTAGPLINKATGLVKTDKKGQPIFLKEHQVWDSQKGEIRDKVKGEIGGVVSFKLKLATKGAKEALDHFNLHVSPEQKLEYVKEYVAPDGNTYSKVHISKIEEGHEYDDEGNPIPSVMYYKRKMPLYRTKAGEKRSLLAIEQAPDKKYTTDAIDSKGQPNERQAAFNKQTGKFDGPFISKNFNVHMDLIQTYTGDPEKDMKTFGYKTEKEFLEDNPYNPVKQQKLNILLQREKMQMQKATIMEDGKPVSQLNSDGLTPWEQIHYEKDEATGRYVPNPEKLIEWERKQKERILNESKWESGDIIPWQSNTKVKQRLTYPQAVLTAFETDNPTDEQTGIINNLEAWAENTGGTFFISDDASGASGELNQEQFGKEGAGGHADRGYGGGLGTTDPDLYKITSRAAPISTAAKTGTSQWINKYNIDDENLKEIGLNNAEMTMKIDGEYYSNEGEKDVFSVTTVHGEGHYIKDKSMALELKNRPDYKTSYAKINHYNALTKQKEAKFPFKPNTDSFNRLSKEDQQAVRNVLGAKAGELPTSNPLDRQRVNRLRKIKGKQEIGTNNFEPEYGFLFPMSEGYAITPEGKEVPASSARSAAISKATWIKNIAYERLKKANNMTVGELEGFKNTPWNKQNPKLKKQFTELKNDTNKNLATYVIDAIEDGEVQKAGQVVSPFGYRTTKEEHTKGATSKEVSEAEKKRQRAREVLSEWGGKYVDKLIEEEDFTPTQEDLDEHEVGTTPEDEKAAEARAASLLEDSSVDTKPDTPVGPVESGGFARIMDGTYKWLSKMPFGETDITKYLPEGVKPYEGEGYIGKQGVEFKDNLPSVENMNTKRQETEDIRKDESLTNQNNAIMRNEQAKEADIKEQERLRKILVDERTRIDQEFKQNQLKLAQEKEQRESALSKVPVFHQVTSPDIMAKFDYTPKNLSDVPSPHTIDSKHPILEGNNIGKVFKSMRPTSHVTKEKINEIKAANALTKIFNITDNPNHTFKITDGIVELKKSGALNGQFSVYIEDLHKFADGMHEFVLTKHTPDTVTHVGEDAANSAKKAVAPSAKPGAGQPTTIYSYDDLSNVMGDESRFTFKLDDGTLIDLVKRDNESPDAFKKRIKLEAKQYQAEQKGISDVKKMYVPTVSRKEIAKERIIGGLFGGSKDKERAHELELAKLGYRPQKGGSKRDTVMEAMRMMQQLTPKSNQFGVQGKQISGLFERDTQQMMGSGQSALTDMGTIISRSQGSPLTDFKNQMLSGGTGILGGSLAANIAGGEGSSTRGIFSMGERFLEDRGRDTSLRLMQGREKDTLSFSLGGTLGLGGSMRPEQGLGSPSGFLAGELISQKQTQNRAPNGRENGAGFRGRNGQ